MSRSNPIETNPSTRNLRWKGGSGDLVYWDKEQSKEVKMELPFEFLVLDVLATISGFDEQENSSYWSNEVRNVNHEPFVVKTSSGTRETGLYKDLACRNKGAKYASSIYLLHDGKVMNFKAAGAALSAWIEFGQKGDVFSGKVRLSGGTEAKKGATTFYVPVFETVDATKQENDAAMKADKELQTYLGTYLSAPKFGREDVEEAEAAPRPSDREVVIEDIDDEPVSLESIPF